MKDSTKLPLMAGVRTAEAVSVILLGIYWHESDMPQWAVLLAIISGSVFAVLTAAISAADAFDHGKRQAKESTNG